ncbi:MAG: BrnT family toxin, partial [Methylocella sp.]
MKTEWDRKKAAANLLKHGVDFADAAIALEDENALTIDDPDFEEQRYKTLALGPQLKVLLIVHTERSQSRIRIISARKAARRETQDYEKQTPCKRNTTSRKLNAE